MFVCWRREKSQFCKRQSCVCVITGGCLVPHTIFPSHVSRQGWWCRKQRRILKNLWCCHYLFLGVEALKILLEASTEKMSLRCVASFHLQRLSARKLRNFHQHSHEAVHKLFMFHHQWFCDAKKAVRSVDDEFHEQIRCFSLDVREIFSCFSCPKILCLCRILSRGEYEIHFTWLEPAARVWVSIIVPQCLNLIIPWKKQNFTRFAL